VLYNLSVFVVQLHSIGELSGRVNPLFPEPLPSLKCLPPLSLLLPVAVLPIVVESLLDRVEVVRLVRDG
jgi:hypothetical protein